jgi:hypothetical protein
LPAKYSRSVIDLSLKSNAIVNLFIGNANSLVLSGYILYHGGLTYT